MRHGRHALTKAVPARRSGAAYPPRPFPMPSERGAEDDVAATEVRRLDAAEDDVAATEDEEDLVGQELKKFRTDMS